MSTVNERTLNEELDGAARALRDLEAESNSLTARLEAAECAGDVAKLHELRARRDMLPVALDAARVNFLRLRVEAEAERHTRARQELAEAEGELEVRLEYARVKLDEFREASRVAGEQRLLVNISLNRVEVARRDLNERRAELSAAVRRAASGEEAAPVQYGHATGLQIVKGGR
jgi:chromosome segregation ATPase